MGKPQVITARILIEPHAESSERTKGYVITALKSSLRNIRDGAVAIALYNEEGEMIGMDVTGVPSEALQVHIEELFDSYEEKTA
jgi:hypothetical protein